MFNMKFLEKNWMCVESIITIQFKFQWYQNHFIFFWTIYVTAHCEDDMKMVLPVIMGWSPEPDPLISSLSSIGSLPDPEPSAPSPCIKLSDSGSPTAPKEDITIYATNHKKITSAPINYPCVEFNTWCTCWSLSAKFAMRGSTFCKFGLGVTSGLYFCISGPGGTTVFVYLKR